MIPNNLYFSIADVYPMQLSSPSEIFSAKVIASKKQAHRPLPSIPALLVLCLACFPLFLAGQSDSKDKAKPKPIPPLKAFVTQHQGTFGGQVVKYTATAEEIHLTDKEGEINAALWSVAYTQDGVTDYSKRPVTFVFNGGPGSASVWLHMGLFGPKLVQVDSDAKTDDGAAPYPLIDNPYGLLDLTDIVFIDPVGTGFSQVVGEGKTEDFWGLNEDASSIAQFIRLWVGKHKRWNAPKYIAGESFGTTRAAGVAYELTQGGQNMALNGLIMISQALDYTGSTPVHDNLIAFVTYLPTMAATAWYHKKAGEGMALEAFVQQARDFALDEYAPALFRGSKLTPEKKQYIAQRLSSFIGLDQSYILQSDLRVLVPRFLKELLRDKGRVLGNLDSRYLGDEADVMAERPTLGDAASYAISSAYTAALNHYFATDLKVEMDRPYLTSNGSLYPKWNWRPVPKEAGWEPSYVNVSRKLSDVLRQNKDLKVMVANGYYDLVTPFFDAEYTFARHGILQDRIAMKYYEAGHMMYTHQPDLMQLAADIRAFLKP
ncbi:MAG: peptidase S10 [Saprospiraceae bacterium]